MSMRVSLRLIAGRNYILSSWLRCNVTNTFSCILYAILRVNDARNRISIVPISRNGRLLASSRRRLKVLIKAINLHGCKAAWQLARREVIPSLVPVPVSGNDLVGISWFNKMNNGTGRCHIKNTTAIWHSCFLTDIPVRFRWT